jgi:hypothetical protein
VGGEAVGHVGGVGSDLSGGVDPGADQLGPDRPLVVGPVPFRRAPPVPGGVPARTGSERAEAERGEEGPAGRHGGSSRGGGRVERRVGERDGEELVRPDAGVGRPAGVDDVEQTKAVGADEPADEGGAGAPQEGFGRKSGVRT